MAIVETYQNDISKGHAQRFDGCERISLIFNCIGWNELGDARVAQKTRQRYNRKLA